MQSCIRRHQAKRELKGLKNEARSVVHFKEVSYKLENKVVELTQTLQRRTIENKELQSKLKLLDTQLASWITKYDDVETKAKALQVEVARPTIALQEFEALDQLKTELDGQLSTSLKKISEQDEQIKKLSELTVEQTKEMETKAAKLKEVMDTGNADSITVTQLRSELSSLREQITRQANSAPKPVARPDGTNFNMATGRAVDGAIATSNVLSTPNGAPKRRARRHSDAMEDTGEPLIEDDRYQSPRAVSDAFQPESNGLQRQASDPKGYLPEIYDDPAEEIMKLLEDEAPLDEDVLSGIIRHLKIPSPNLDIPPSPKEVLFPAHLISLVTNEMWKYGMMRESERFLANVMQTVQQHVMVRPFRCAFFVQRLTIDSIGIRRERCGRTGDLLALERPRDSFVRLHCGKRYSPRNRTRRRRNRTRLRLGRLRATGHDRQARPRLAGVQHLSYVDARNEETTAQNGRSRSHRIAVAPRIRHLRHGRTTLQPTRRRRERRARVQHGRHSQFAQQGVEESEELLRRAFGSTASDHGAAQVDRSQQFQRPVDEEEFQFVETSDANSIVSLVAFPPRVLADGTIDVATSLDSRNGAKRTKCRKELCNSSISCKQRSSFSSRRYRASLSFSCASLIICAGFATRYRNYLRVSLPILEFIQ